VSHVLKVTDPVYSEAERIAGEKDITMKEAIAIMCRNGEQYDV